MTSKRRPPRLGRVAARSAKRTEKPAEPKETRREATGDFTEVSAEGADLMTRELGPLRNGNPRGDLSKVRRCGAKTRRGTACLCPAIRNGRCRLHGGKSTGPLTAEGLERSRRARWKHGRYSREAREAAREARWNDPSFLESERQAAKRRLEREARRESKRRWARDEKQMDHALASDAEAYWIYPKDPSVQAFTDLMNRTLGKPTEHVEMAQTGALEIRWKDAEDRLLAGRKRVAEARRERPSDNR